MHDARGIAEGGVLYTEGGWPEEVKAFAGRGVDVALDSVGSTWPESASCLRPGGRLVVFGATGGTEVALEVRPFYFGQLSMLGTTMGSPRDFAGLMEMVIEGRWKPVLDSVRPLEEAGAALERLESGDHFGKLALAVD